MGRSFRKPMSSDDDGDGGGGGSDTDDSFDEVEPVFYPQIPGVDVDLEDGFVVQVEAEDELGIHDRYEDDDDEEPDDPDDESFSLNSESTNSQDDPEEFEDSSEDSDVLLPEIGCGRGIESTPASPDPEVNDNDNGGAPKWEVTVEDSPIYKSDPDDNSLSTLDGPSDHDHDDEDSGGQRASTFEESSVPSVENGTITLQGGLKQLDSTNSRPKRKRECDDDEDCEDNTSGVGVSGRAQIRVQGTVPTDPRIPIYFPQMIMNQVKTILLQEQEQHSPAESPSSTLSAGFAGAEEEDDQLSYSNPMVSGSEDEALVAGSTLAGDKIGNTTYSERHVIRMLIKWYQELPKYASSVPNTDSFEQVNLPENHDDQVDNPNPTIRLDRDFKKELTILWDMSSETDVIGFLVEKGVFNVICWTIERSQCGRLTEISLGILSNLLSSIAVLDQFQRSIDPNLEILEKIKSLVIGTSSSPQMSNCVPVLIQAFAVLRRVAWYLVNKELVESWTTLLTSNEFMSQMQFLLRSSTNVHLLVEIIHTLLQLLQSVVAGDNASPSPDSSSIQESQTNSSSPSIPPINLSFCSFISSPLVESLIEALFELFKSIEENCLNDTDDVKGVKEGITAGLECFCYFERNVNGKEALISKKDLIFKFLSKFHNQLLNLCPINTEEEEIQLLLSNFISSLNLSLFLQYSNPQLNPSNFLDLLQCGRSMKTGNSEVSETIDQILYQFIIEIGKRFKIEWMEEMKKDQLEEIINDSDNGAKMEIVKEKLNNYLITTGT